MLGEIPQLELTRANNLTGVELLLSDECAKKRALPCPVRADHTDVFGLINRKRGSVEKDLSSVCFRAVL